MWEGGGGGRRRREGGSTNAEGILREGGSMTFNLVTVRVPEEVQGGEGRGGAWDSEEVRERRQGSCRRACREGGAQRSASSNEG